MVRVDVEAVNGDQLDLLVGLVVRDVDGGPPSGSTSHF